jgi:hypothetical protein
MLRLFYYVFIWPFRLLVGGLVDDVLVLIGLKYTTPSGPPVWHEHPFRAAFARRCRRAVRRDGVLPRASIARRDDRPPPR